MNNSTESNYASSSNSNGTSRKRKAEDGSPTGKRKRKAAKNGSGSKAAKRKVNETRAARYKNVCSNDTKLRMERALNQPIHLIDFKEIDATKHEYSILGPTGCIYTTTISHVVSCSCPDFQDGHHCKHILFVFLKVLKVNQNCPLIYQKALITKELNLILKKSSKITLPSKERVEQLKTIALKNQQKRKPKDGDCQICFETLGNQKKLIWCENGCGNNVHLDCFNKWEETLSVGQKVKYQL
ncbi:hypothetical protein Glove_493g50 [Diversispora epigaea]|uniref:SWIM-type domain-containing protein n=1 Tax=Diversispora epigaea TaxID=1348612 RepID=A0A397GID2_9GLOM|nr:hypothetical protein Glove_493g50 [Diversispora epigaea]